MPRRVDVACSTPGALIATAEGERPVETLHPGDRVVTRDNGLQEIAWVGRKVLDWAQIKANPHIRPILISAGALGNGVPERDLLVSPNHRMLAPSELSVLHFDGSEVLVAAKHLVDSRHIRQVPSLGISYIHFMFERHEIVLANGAWTESFQPGDRSLATLGNAQRQELADLFPRLRSASGRRSFRAARPTLRRLFVHPEDD
jgi:hypothetical protein